MIQKTNYNLLYCEDDQFVREMVVEYLEDYFANIYVANDGQEALELYELYAPDIVITDIEMPKKNGLQLALELRQQNKEIPIIISTAYTSTEYFVKAVELNLVKYLIKPIEEEALQEALNSALERIKSSNGSSIPLSHEYHFDMFSKLLIQEKKPIPLTQKQSDFIYLLLKNKSLSVSYDEIQHYVWKDKVMSDAALRSLVYDLRKIIHKNIIQNVSKMGYKINIHG